MLSSTNSCPDFGPFQVCPEHALAVRSLPNDIKESGAPAPNHEHAGANGGALSAAPTITIAFCAGARHSSSAAATGIVLVGCRHDAIVKQGRCASARMEADSMPSHARPADGRGTKASQQVARGPEATS